MWERVFSYLYNTSLIFAKYVIYLVLTLQSRLKNKQFFIFIYLFWQNDDRIFYFWVEYAFKLVCIKILYMNYYLLLNQHILKISIINVLLSEFKSSCNNEPKRGVNY